MRRFCSLLLSRVLRALRCLIPLCSRPVLRVRTVSLASRQGWPPLFAFARTHGLRLGSPATGTERASVFVVPPFRASATSVQAAISTGEGNDDGGGECSTEADDEPSACHAASSTSASGGAVALTQSVASDRSRSSVAQHW